jgi:hypothetical protein
MIDEDSKHWLGADFWASPLFSWALVGFGVVLFYVIPTPSFLKQIAQCSQGMTPRNLLILGYLFAIAAIPIFGLWRLSIHLGMPRALALLYLFFPIVTVAIYFARTLVDRVMPDY